MQPAQCAAITCNHATHGDPLRCIRDYIERVFSSMLNQPKAVRLQVNPERSGPWFHSCSARPLWPAHAKGGVVFTVDFKNLELRDFWHDEAPRERGRGSLPFGAADGAAQLSVVYLEIAPGDHFGLHTDSADELVIIVSGDAVVTAGGASAELDAGMAAVIPALTPHSYTNISAEPLRILAIFAGSPVTSAFQYPLQPWGARTVEVQPSTVRVAGD